jgi:hypothetical protein
MEMTAAGIDEEKVSPTFKPRYTLEAVKTTVMSAPMIIPRSVNSRRLSVGWVNVFIYLILDD